MNVNDEKKKVTIYSVAHEAGVSLATVSRVINDSSLVKEATKKKVEDAIIKLGYRPNAVAQGLALKKTTNIALIVPDSSFLYIGKIINGLLDVAKIYKYTISLYTTSSTISEMDEIIDSIVKSRADGVIVFNESLGQQDIETLESFHMPLVYIGQKVTSESACCVYVDYTQAVYEQATKYLDKGIDDIVLVEDKKNPIYIDELLSGIEKAFNEHGKQFNGFIQIPDDYHNSYDFLNGYFKEHKHKVIFALRDSQAMAVLNACQENGIAIPEDTDLICVMDSRFLGMVRPQISSFMTPSYDIGALAMRVITKLLHDDELEEKEYLLNYFYKHRGSTKD